MMEKAKGSLDEFRKKLYPYVDKKTGKEAMGLFTIFIYSLFIFLVVYLIIYMLRPSIIMRKDDEGNSTMCINGTYLFLTSLSIFIIVSMILFFYF